MENNLDPYDHLTNKSVTFVAVDTAQNNLFPSDKDDIDAFFKTKHKSYISDTMQTISAVEQIVRTLLYKDLLQYDVKHFYLQARFRCDVPLNTDFASVLKNIIEDRSKVSSVITHTYIAEKILGISKAKFSRYINDIYPMPAELFVKLCIYLRVDRDEFDLLYATFRGTKLAKSRAADIIFYNMAIYNRLCNVYHSDGTVRTDKRVSLKKYEQMLNIYKKRVVAACIELDEPYDDFLDKFGPLTDQDMSDCTTGYPCVIAEDDHNDSGHGFVFTI